MPAAAVPRTIGDVLAGHRWNMQSEALGGVSLVADFYPGGRFDGTVTAPPSPVGPLSQRINGSWHIAGSWLILQWKWIEQDLGPVGNDVHIEITDLSRDELVGMDQTEDVSGSGYSGDVVRRLWEFYRIDGQ